MRGRSFYSIFAVALVVTVGCAQLLGLDGLTNRVDGGSDASADVANDAAPEANACPLVHPPPPPAQDDPSDASLEFFNVVRTIDLGQSEAGAAFGYDIDNVWTCCEGAPESCVPPVATNKHCDEDGGIDNGVGPALLKVLIIGVGGLNQDTLNAAIDGGAFSMGFALASYNGQPNDHQVVVSAFVSSGTVGADGGYLHQASWDGNDVWSIDQASTPGGTDDAGIPYAFHVDTNAYVTNGVVVAHMTFPFFFGSGSGSGAITTITDAVMTGRLVLANGAYHVEDAQLTGRIRLTDVFLVMHGLPNPFVPGTFVCPGTAAYDYIKPVICQLADVNADKTLDNTGAPCDALSFSAAFTTFPAVPGPVVNPGNSPSPCLDAGTEQCP